jgi:uncharacterized Zn finger protein
MDGNAIAGLLFDVFAVEMTTAMATCAGCGAVAPVAEHEVYLHAPGTVVRCRSCGSLSMVFVTIRDVTCVDLRGIRALETV